GLDIVGTMAGVTRDPGGERRGRNLAALAGQPDQLERAAEEFGRAAFVGRDMRLGVAEHAAPGRVDMGECERIRGRADGDEKHRGVMLENLADAALDRAGEIVVAITERKTAIGARDRVE